MILFVRRHKKEKSDKVVKRASPRHHDIVSLPYLSNVLLRAHGGNHTQFASNGCAVTKRLAQLNRLDTTMKVIYRVREYELTKGIKLLLAPAPARRRSFLRA